MYKMTYEGLLADNLRLARALKETETELAQERQKHNKSVDLLIKGERLREVMMFNAILDGCIPNCGPRKTRT